MGVQIKPPVSIPQLAVRPVGLVIDDDPEPLLTSLEAWMKKRWAPWLVPEFVWARGATLNGEVFDLAERADFVLLDNRFRKGTMGTYREGLEVGRLLVERWPDLPVFFYTAFPRDWCQGRRRNGDLRNDVQVFLDNESVRQVEKGSLSKEESLRRLCGDILAVTGEKLRERAAGSRTLRKLLESEVIEDTRRLYRIERIDLRRRTQVLLDLEASVEQWVEVPTKLLEGAGIHEEQDVELRVLEFSGGQVVTYFESGVVGHEVAEEVRAYILETESENHGI